jgi:Asp-tRNA(Asn)/Glu-tRNA(Gln) amidotransferase A subunit family amidase
MVCHDVILKFPPRSVCSVALPSGGDHDPPLPALTMPPRSRANRLARVTLALAVLALVTGTRPAAARTRRTAPSTSVAETSLADLRTALEQRRIASREIVQQYLARIAMYEDQLNAVITVNPRALAIADSLDHERAAGRVRGPLHGILIALKDNIYTTSMRTTGGAMAFADLVPPYDAMLTHHLEAAEAIILAKTQRTELANWTASGMPDNDTDLTGYGMNPGDPRRDPRESVFDGRPVPDPTDTATRACTPPSGNDYTRFLDADRRKDILLSATSGIDAALAAHQLDALLFPGVNSANIGARPGYPSVTVPYALLPVAQGTSGPAFPPGFTPRPAPFGVTFTASACAEPTLIGLAYAFEQATKKREAPPLFP